jgi:hypothetical protein
MDQKKQYALLLALHYDRANSKETLVKALENLGIDSYDYQPNPGPDVRKFLKSVEEGETTVEKGLHKLEFFDLEVRFLLSVSLHLAVNYLETVLKK